MRVDLAQNFMIVHMLVQTKNRFFIKIVLADVNNLPTNVNFCAEYVISKFFFKIDV